MAYEAHERMRESLAAVVPCFNAGERVRPVVERLCVSLRHVLVIDDGCTDGCVDTLRDLDARILRFDTNRGKGHALLAGFAAALEIPEMQAVCVLDADGQHDPNELPGLFGAFIEGDADLLIGARVFDRESVPWRSRFGNRVSARLMRLLLGPGITDTQCGYRLLSRRFAEAVVREVPGGRYETEMRIVVKAIRDGARVVSAPVRTIYESGNPSSHFRKVRDSIRVIGALLGASRRPFPRRESS